MTTPRLPRRLRTRPILAGGPLETPDTLDALIA
jgi:hypothetical protein